MDPNSAGFVAAASAGVFIGIVAFYAWKTFKERQNDYYAKPYLISCAFGCNLFPFKGPFRRAFFV